MHVLGTGGAVQAAVRDDDAGSLGARLTLADGRRVLVRFSTAGSGGTLEIRAADGALLSSGALPTTVVAPPLFVN